jgi:hypothetical protein
MHSTKARRRQRPLREASARFRDRCRRACERCAASHPRRTSRGRPGRARERRRPPRRRQCIERGIVGALPPERRLDEAIDFRRLGFEVEIDSKALADAADHPAPVVEQIRVAHPGHLRPRVREFDDPLHVRQPQREAFVHRHVAALVQRLRDFERIADRHDVNRPVAGAVERRVPERRQHANARILDQDRRRLAILGGEQRDDVVRELVAKRILRQIEVDEVPRAAEMTKDALVERDHFLRLPRSLRIVAELRRPQVGWKVRPAQIEHAGVRRGPLRCIPSTISAVRRVTGVACVPNRPCTSVRDAATRSRARTGR